MQHILEVAGASDLASDATGEAKPREVLPKFTPHATLEDPWWAFLRGVFEFPFDPDVIPHWIKLAFTGTIELMLVWWILDNLALGTSGTHGLALCRWGACDGGPCDFYWIHLDRNDVGRRLRDS